MLYTPTSNGGIAPSNALTLTDAPLFTIDELIPNTTRPSTFSWTNASASSSFTLLSGVTVTLVGQSDILKEPYKAMSDWQAANKYSIVGFDLTVPLKVSSWTIVVDLTFKDTFKEVRTIDTSDDTKVPPTVLTNANY